MDTWWRLPGAIQKKKNSLKARLKPMVLRWFARSRRTAALYYLLLNKSLGREQRAVLLGRLQYLDSVRRVSESSPLLRRNVHRIEKGLVSRPRRAVFARGFIGETVESYARAAGNPKWAPEERKWATDVLEEYFSVVGPDPAIDAARQTFDALALGERTPDRAVPYAHRQLDATAVEYDELLALLRRRRSIRWYEPREVPMEAIRRAANAAAMAPSACNRQPFRFIVVNDREMAPRVASCAPGTGSFAHNVPCVVVVVGDLSAYPQERDRHVIYIDGALATMSFMLALETLGLSSCPVNWPDVEKRERELSKLLRLSYFERPIMLLTVGFADPDGGVPYSQKKSDRLLVREVRSLGNE